MIMPDRVEFVNTNIDTLLLYLISQQAMYGYQIIKVLHHRSNGYFNFKEGTLYPALHRLEKNGYIEGQWQNISSGQQRKYYHITDKGLEVLNHKKNNWLEFLNAYNMVLKSKAGDYF
jgi:PadR family transcriptional regulator, regulatory protein PadR